MNIDLKTLNISRSELFFEVMANDDYGLPDYVKGVLDQLQLDNPANISKINVLTLIDIVRGILEETAHVIRIDQTKGTTYDRAQHHIASEKGLSNPAAIMQIRLLTDFWQVYEGMQEFFEENYDQIVDWETVWRYFNRGFVNSTTANFQDADREGTRSFQGTGRWKNLQLSRRVDYFSDANTRNNFSAYLLSKGFSVAEITDLTSYVRCYIGEEHYIGVSTFSNAIRNNEVFPHEQADEMQGLMLKDHAKVDEYIQKLTVLRDRAIKMHNLYMQITEFLNLPEVRRATNYLDRLLLNIGDAYKNPLTNLLWVLMYHSERLIEDLDTELRRVSFIES